jgi:uncharacterized membrane protein YcaP (DUF421 family)
MEMDGKISFQPKESLLPATKKDMKITTSEQDLTTNVIIDTTLLENNLKEINKTKEWLDKELKKQNYNSYDNILLATIDKNNQVTVYNKDVKPTKSSVLE